MSIDSGFGSIVPGIGPAEAYAQANLDPVAEVQPLPDTGSTVVVGLIPDPITTSAIAEAMAPAPDPKAVRRRWGVIAGINSDGTVNVVVDGTVIPNMSRLASYQPSVNETVQLNIVQGDSLVVGATAPSLRSNNRPTGDLEQTLRLTAKPDTLLVNGQVVLRTAYPNLWAWVNAQGLLIPGYFTAGDGSTTFGLPNMCGRVAIGVGTLGADTYASGNTIGTAKPTITSAQIPPHSHAVVVAAHTTHQHGTTVAAHATHDHNVSASHSASHSHGFTTSSGGSHGHSFTTDQGGNHAGHFPAQATYVSGPGTFGMAAWDTLTVWSPTHNHTGGTSTAASHNHSGTTGDDGTYTHTIGESTTGPTTHSVTEPSAGPTSHSVTETALPAATAIDVRQPSLAINWLIWT